jgi:hypothetical protein
LVLKTYADEKHLDVTKAVNLLPALPTPTPMLASAGSTEVPNPVVQIVVPTSGERGALEGSAGHRSPSGEKSAPAKKAKNSRDSDALAGRASFLHQPAVAMDGTAGVKHSISPQWPWMALRA